MEKNWKDRWEKFMFIEDTVVGGGTVLNPKPETYGDFVRMLDGIEKFISQELDKAREETLDEVKHTLAKDTRYELRFTEISELLSKLKGSK